MIGKPTRSTQVRVLVNGATMPERDRINLIGAGVSAVDNATDQRTDITIVGGGGGEFGGSAADVTYSAEYPTVQAALDHLLYVAASVSGFTNNIGTIEIGQPVFNVILSWTLNKPMLSISLDNGIGAIDPAATNYNYSATLIASRTFTITVNDGISTSSATTTVNFSHKRYWGVSSSPTLDSAGILALSKEFSSSRVQSRSISPSGQYIYFAYPASWGLATFTVNGLPNTAWTLSVQSFVNAQGQSNTFNVYRSDNLLTGTYTIGVT